jgi:sugar lactone lactonase YvrE
VYVTESEAGRVTRIALQDGSRRVVAFGLSQPEGIAALPDRSLAVVEVGAKRLTQIAPIGGTQTVLVSNLPIGRGNGPSLFRGVAASATALYINSDIDNAVYKVRRLPQ